MKKHVNYFLILLPILLLVAGSALTDPKKAGPNHGAPKNVTECGTVLTEPGNYKLANDLLDCPEHGILILGSDITLNLKGHEISCPNGWLGVFVIGSEEATVKNVTVKNGYVTNCGEGIALWLAEDSKVMNVTSTGNQGAGIVLWESNNNVIMHNFVHDNATNGILSWQSSGNLFKHNTSTDNGFGFAGGEGTGIALDNEQNSRIMCNRVHGNADGIILFSGSSGNLLRGNLVTGNFGGIIMLGFAWDGDPWQDIPAGNTVRSNIVEDNGRPDFYEIYLDVVTDDLLVHPEDVCMNTWEKNQFETELGPSGCFGIPVELDEKDVCALDDDD